MLSEREALARLQALNLPAGKHIWATRMIMEVTLSCLDRDVFMAYLVGCVLRDEAAADLLARGAVIETDKGAKKNPNHGVYNLEVAKLVRLSKLLNIEGMVPFDGA